jgi:hypothetical protein
MPDKYLLCKDNTMELSRDSRLTREVPFFSLGSHEWDVIQMKRQSSSGARRATAISWEIRYLAVVGFALLTSACATLGPDSPNDEKVKVVTARATARWQAIIGKDFAAAYDFMSPATRATVTPAGFKTVASRIDYRNARVTEATCEGGTCRVKLILTYNAGLSIRGGQTTPMNGINTPLEENWVIDKGQIWYVWPI